jgi:hypothetical protein
VLAPRLIVVFIPQFRPQGFCTRPRQRTLLPHCTYIVPILYLYSILVPIPHTQYCPNPLHIAGTPPPATLLYTYAVTRFTDGFQLDHESIRPSFTVIRVQRRLSCPRNSSHNSGRTTRLRDMPGSTCHPQLTTITTAQSREHKPKSAIHPPGKRV